MVATLLLWLLVWGGMFSGIYNIQSPEFLSSAFDFIQGTRALLPIFAVYLCLLWILAARPKFPFVKSPIGFFFAYCCLGLLTSLFLSPDRVTSLYWGGIYLAPFLVIWLALGNTESGNCISRLIYVNYTIFFMVTVSLLPEAFRTGWGNLPPFQQYELPFGLGLIRTNGAGRFALVVISVSAVRLIIQKKKTRFLWLFFLFPSLFLLTQTQSRTALLGLVVAGILFVFLRGMDWRFIFVGPLAAFVVWISGLEWRAHGHWDNLLSLTGREVTWQKALEQIKHSPFLGWGFHGDRILLQVEHMHNSYLHAMIHTGLIGAIFFLAAIIGIWLLILKIYLRRRASNIQLADNPLLIESILIIGFLTARSFFESTAAFYGVDLLLLLPAMAYLSLSAQEITEEAEFPPEKS